MTDTDRHNLTAALPANPNHDGPIGINSHDLRHLLDRLVDTTALGDAEPRYTLGDGCR